MDCWNSLSEVPQGRSLHCPQGSHQAMYDDQETYMRGLVDFLLAEHPPRA